MQINRLRCVLGSRLRLLNPPISLVEALYQAFTFANPIYEQVARHSPYGASSRIAEKITLVEPDGDALCLPRGVTEEQIPSRFRPMWRRRLLIDERLTAPVTFPALDLALNAEQKQLMAAFKQHCSNPFNHGVYVYVLPTGGGKTIFQAAAAAYLGQRTLILCLTEQIKHVWWTDLCKAYKVERDKIGLIQKADFCFGEHFTLASMRTLARRKERWDEIFKNHGTVILDEAQTIGAPTVSDFIQACPCRNILGATATDTRHFGGNFWLPSLLGPVRERITAQQDDTSTSFALRDVEVVDTEMTCPDMEVVDWQLLLEAMLVDEDRNALIVRKVMQDVKRGNVPLVITKRLSHVHLLVDLLRARGVATTNLLTGATNADRAYTSALIAAIGTGKVKCLVASVQAIMLGTNIPALSSLHLTTPMVDPANIEQIIGRVRRRAPGKTGCRFVYYLDKRVGYLQSLFTRSVFPVLQKLQVPGYVNAYRA